MTELPRYPPIAEHGMIGDLQTCALISSDGVLDWFCAPRFDAPSLFASLVDHDRGGYFRLAADAPEPTARQLYLPDTAILVTRFLTRRRRRRGRRLHAASANPSAPRPTPALVRILRVVRGDVTLRPRVPSALRLRARRARADPARRHGPPSSTAPTSTCTCRPPSRWPPRGRGRGRLGHPRRRGDRRGRADTTEPGRTPEPITLGQLEAEHERTTRFWHDWLRGSSYHGRWQTMVQPLRHHPQAVDVRADRCADRRGHHRPARADRRRAQLGLPLHLGARRRADARAPWPSSASSRRPTRSAAGSPSGCATGGTRAGEPLQIMYRIDGEPLLVEEVLDHLEGYEKSAPVRIGQRRRRPAPARRLRRGHLGPDTVAGAGRGLPATRAGSRWPRCSTGSRRTGTGRTRASGRPAAAARTSRSAG